MSARPMISMFRALMLIFLLSPGSSYYDTVNLAHKQPFIVKLPRDSNYWLVIGFRTFSIKFWTPNDS